MVHGGFMLLMKSNFPHFMNSYLDSQWYKKFINSNVMGGNGAIGNLKKIDLENYYTFFTSTSEENKINEYYKYFDNLISLHQRKLTLLENIKKALLNKIFPKNNEIKPEIRFKGFVDAWEQKKLIDEGKTYSGLSNKTKFDFNRGDAKFITYLNVLNNEFIDLRMHGKISIDKTQNLVKNGDILFTISSETPHDIGMSSVYLGDENNLYLNSFCFGYRFNKKINDSIFIGFLFRSSKLRKEISDLAQGISRFNMSKSSFLKLNINFPKYDEQIYVGNLFSNVNNLISLHQRKLKKLENIKKALLNKMFI
ncbi:type I restriction-modification system, specificity subunit S [[Mycoplasma] phocae]|uniref:Type I restriction-modification system, specificity subunit S n=2 Tax=[Mycoplasma] phocae TaxID=142651 RepID=A0A2Z5IQ09_9BACT|nr:type I restriction-modification system, specificity subunit S [[Mycoplasma] phocae]